MVLMVLLLSVVSFGNALLSRCDIEYQRCMFNCVQEFPLDKDKRDGCELRCKLNKGACSAGEALEEVRNKLNKFWEGFSKDK